MSHTVTAPAASTLVLPFMKAVRDVFQKMAGVQTTVGRPQLKAEPIASYDVCGIIGFSGQISGSVVVSFSDAAAERLVAAFAGMPIDRSSPDFADAVGELANMIAGSAKKDLGADASISVPTVVIGSGYRIAGMSNAPSLIIPCDSPYGAFAVEVSIKRTPAA